MLAGACSFLLFLIYAAVLSLTVFGAVSSEMLA